MESVLTSFSVPTLANNIAPGRFGGTVAAGNAAVTLEADIDLIIQ